MAITTNPSQTAKPSPDVHNPGDSMPALLPNLLSFKSIHNDIPTPSCQ
jgi:hypothetical protein